MTTSGTPIGAKEAFDIGLVDRIIEGDLQEHAVGYAEEVREVRPLPKSSERQDKVDATDPGTFDEFRKANARKFRGFEAPEKNIQAVEAAVRLPYAEGVIEERKLFMELMSGTQARAQQYFFFAERKAAKIENIPENTQPRVVKKVGVIGAGTMGGGISMNFLSAGSPVTIVEMAQDALDRGTGIMRKNYEATAAKGRMTGEQVEQAMGLLNPTLDFDALADCDLIIEAVFEQMDIKKDVFGRIDNIAKQGAILASNTSYLNIDEIAASIDKSEANTRQILTRARSRLRDSRPRFTATRRESEEIVRHFRDAVVSGNVDQLMAVLHADATFVSDGGGKAAAATRPLLGPDRISKFLLGYARKGHWTESDFQFVTVNGTPGLLMRHPLAGTGAYSFDIADGRIRAIYVVRNPDKLRAFLEHTH